MDDIKSSKYIREMIARLPAKLRPIEIKDQEEFIQNYLREGVIYPEPPSEIVVEEADDVPTEPSESSESKDLFEDKSETLSAPLLKSTDKSRSSKAPIILNAFSENKKKLLSI